VSGWIRRLFGGRTAIEEQRENPALAAAVQQSALIYDRIPLRDFISDERRAELGRDLYLEMSRICNATHPVTACREKYAGAMLLLAPFQVLMIRPAPREDESGLRGQPGVTGELNSNLVELFKNNDDLRAAMFAVSDLNEYDDYWQLLQRLYWESFWLLETLRAGRTALGDVSDGDDWNDAFLHATCVGAELTFRQDLELPSAFDPQIAGKASIAYSMFIDIVMSGAANPAAEWRDYYQDSGISMPDNAHQ
jgi:hypothetical protein